MRLKLLFLNLRITCYRLIEWGRVVVHYYPRFFLTDLKLAWHYIGCNPYKMCSFDYGETPLTTLDRMATACRILSTDTVLELGCGTGRTAFWLRTFIGCRVIGVDLVSPFIEKARRVRTDVTFRVEDILKTSLEADVIYLYGTSFSDLFIKKLTQRLASLSSKTRIMTISYPLCDYDSRFTTLKTVSLSFPWGKTEGYLNIFK